MPNNPIIITKSHKGEDFNEAFYIGYHLDLKNINVAASFSENYQVNLCPTTETSLREWHHTVITYDNKFLCFYLDGILENKAVKDFETQFQKEDSVLIGLRRSVKNNRCLNAVVDDIEIYNRVLTPTEVSTLYHAPNPNKLSLVLKWLFIFALLAGLCFIVFRLIRWRIKKALKTEKEKNELRNNWYEQENRVLTAQMNPHFIFNSLNTIQQFIIINDSEKAQLYLLKFSRLLRMILENNLKDSILLDEEIQVLKQYLEIESLRFNHVFKYTIALGNIEAKEIKIPKFLIQPFVENAVWHGLLPKEGQKSLEISFEKINERTLSCVINDNGVGRKSTKDGGKGKNRSLAINFIKQRLVLMSKLYKANYGIQIDDKIDSAGESAGTRITALLPIL